MVTPDAKRNAVAHARETFGLSERRSSICAIRTRTSALHALVPQADVFVGN
jgi:hypothetical protein